MKTRLRRSLHWLFFIILAVATLLALFYAVEDWRGARAWDQFRREMQARGESLDPRAYDPPPVPDARNLAMAPLFARAFRYKTDPATGALTFDSPNFYDNNPDYRTLSQMPHGKNSGTYNVPAQHGAWNTGHRVQLAAWLAYYATSGNMPHSAQPGDPAADILLALSRYDAPLAELAQAAAERSLARWPVNYTQRPTYSIALPHTFIVQQLQRTLRLRACARLATGQTAAARSDMELLFRLNESLDGEPTLIAGLIQANGIDFFLQPLWEGLAARQWSDADLKAFQAKLGGVDILGTFRHGLLGGEIVLFQGQLADDMNRWDHAREIQKSLPMMAGASAPSGAWSLWFFLPLLPRGWYVQNAVVGSRCLLAGQLEAIDPAHHRVRPAPAKAMTQTIDRLPQTPYNFMARIYLPAIQTVAVIPARAQALVDEANVACALERYWLDRHAYPDRLDALVPTYLARAPRDLIDDAPMRYRRTGDGRFQLWSVGWDEHDDGGSIVWPADRQWRAGVPAPKGGEPSNFPNPRKDQGDWVWQYAPAEPPDPPANLSRLE